MDSISVARYSCRTLTHTHIYLFDYVHHYTHREDYFLTWGVEDWVGGSFLLLVTFRGVIFRSMRRCLRCWRNEGVETGTACWDCCFRALDRRIMRDNAFKLVRGGLRDSVDVASARVRLFVDGGWGSSFSTSDPDCSFSDDDDDDGEEHEVDSLPSWVRGAIEAFSLRAGRIGLRATAGGAGGATVEVVEFWERSESFARRSKIERRIRRRLTNAMQSTHSFCLVHGKRCPSSVKLEWLRQHWWHAMEQHWQPSHSVGTIQSEEIGEHHTRILARVHVPVSIHSRLYRYRHRNHATVQYDSTVSW